MFYIKSAVFILIVFMRRVFPECLLGCQTCSGQNCTSCESYYFLSDGNCSPCPVDCESCNGYDNCTSCKPKKHGLHVRCVFDCESSCLNGECQDDTADCTQCKLGFYGRLCQHNCSFCVEERCDLLSCSSGCRDGYYEFNSGVETICVTCSGNCKVCKNRDICHVCNDGFYLLKYNNKVVCVSCPPEISCSEYCVIDDCNQCQKLNNSLVCTDCPEGQRFNGKTCELNTTLCSQECSTHCDPYGICQGECNDGWSGEKCNKKCFDRCLKCSKENSSNCTNCKGDFYSSNCNLVCNPSCLFEKNTNTCENSGYCLHGCRLNHWGEICNKTCPGGCYNQVCDRNNGTCTRGCKVGYVGDICVQITTVSQTEAIEISPSTTTFTVSKTVSKQQTSLKPEKYEDKGSDFVVGYMSGIGTSIVIVVIVALLHLITRRYLARKSPRANSRNVDFPTYINTRTDFEIAREEPADVAGNYEKLSSNRISDNMYTGLRTASL